MLWFKILFKIFLLDNNKGSQDNGGGLVHTVNGISRVVGIHQYTTGYRDGEYSVYCNGKFLPLFFKNGLN